MDRKRTGPLYSPFGCGATIFLVLALAVILLLRGGGPFSPGQLSAARPMETPLAGFASHADFEGQCGLCHAPWQGITGGRCENCHTGVADQRESSSGLHGVLTGTEQCAGCHPEHQGRSAELIAFDLTGFEHQQITGFSLEHHQRDFDQSGIECEDCHLKGLSAATEVNCLDCHATGQPTFMFNHSTFYGEDCLACHDGQDAMVAFNHDDVFPLEGAHAAAQCADCHRPAILSGTPVECAGCHQEPAVHLGLFGDECGRCHTSLAWQPAQLTQHTFPLDHGGEGKIACETCHSESYVTHTCFNCHAHDEENTRTEHLEEGILDIADCVACHPTGQKDEAEREGRE